MRDRRPAIKVYEADVKSNKFKITNKEHPLIDDISTTEVHIGNIDKSSETLLQNYLYTNPFLYNPETSNVTVHSIEDFIIDTKYEQIALGDILRNPRYSPRERKKYIKKAFKSWRKEYLKEKNTTFKENDKVIEVIGDISHLGYKGKSKLFLFLTFILLIFLVVTNSLIWDVFKKGSFGYSIYTTLETMYTQMSWTRTVGNLGIYSLLVLIFFSTIYSYIIKDFKRHYKLAQSFLSNSESSISRDFNRKYNKARKYYLKRVNNKKNPYFPPLAIEEVQEGKMNIRIFNAICKSTIDRAYKVKKSKPYIKATKLVLQYIGYISAIVIIIMSLYSLVKNIFS